MGSAFTHVQVFQRFPGQVYQHLVQKAGQELKFHFILFYTCGNWDNQFDIKRILKKLFIVYRDQTLCKLH